MPTPLSLTLMRASGVSASHSVADRRPGRLGALAGVDGVGHDVQDRAVDALGIDHDAGKLAARMPAQLHAQLGRRGTA